VTRNHHGSPYASLHARLIAGTTEPDNEQACWLWFRQRDRYGYGRLTIWVPGLGCTVKLTAHILLYVWGEARCNTVDEAYLAYLELTSSGLELDHLCKVPSCIRPDHLEPVTPSVNCQRRGSTWVNRRPVAWAGVLLPGG
jgi:hypothetical protein